MFKARAPSGSPSTFSGNRCAAPVLVVVCSVHAPCVFNASRTVYHHFWPESSISSAFTPVPLDRGQSHKKVPT